MIYYILDITNNILKIGITGDVGSRLTVIQSTYPFPLLLVAVHWGDFESEQAVHEQFKHLRLRGEWFTFTDELRDYVVEAHDDDVLFEHRHYYLRAISEIMTYMNFRMIRAELGHPTVSLVDFLPAFISSRTPATK